MTKNEVIEQHYRDNYRKLLKIMTFRAGTEWDAADVIQEAYARAVKYYRNYDKAQPFDAWFKTILNNALRQHKNAEMGLVTNSFEEEEAEGIPCTHYAERVTDEVDKLINRRNPQQQEILNYWWKQGYTGAEISQFTNIPYKTCYQTIFVFKTELKELYK
jgi:RNA polymerase sigma factor (sigma-70 family)